LAVGDPLPGDPDAIREQAAGLRNTAVEITWQVSHLRRIGADESMRALSVEALQSQALDVAKRLEAVIGRYSKTAGYLGSWADELEGFREATVKVLGRAQDAERAAGRDPHAEVGNQVMFAYQVFAPAGVGDASGVAAAELEVAAARRELARIVEEAAGRDRFWAGRISDAIDDRLTDSFWEGVHNWIEHHKGWVDDLNTVLGVATTAAALAAMAFPPLGAGVLAISAVGLAVHGVEYEAGDASLVEIGLDIAGLASFGAGRLISHSLEGTFKATRTAAAEAAGQKAADAVLEEASDVQAAADGVMADPTSSLRDRFSAQMDLDGIKRQAFRADYDGFQDVLEAPSADVGFWKGLWAGSREDAHYLNDSRNLLADFSEDGAVRRAAAGLGRLSIAGKANWIPATLVDLNDKAAEHVPALPYGERYGRWKEHFVRSEGTFE
jgi:hypothetical protein